MITSIITSSFSKVATADRRKIRVISGFGM